MPQWGIDAPRPFRPSNSRVASIPIKGIDAPRFSFAHEMRASPASVAALARTRPYEPRQLVVPCLDGHQAIRPWIKNSYCSHSS